MKSPDITQLSVSESIVGTTFHYANESSWERLEQTCGRCCFVYLQRGGGGWGENKNITHGSSNVIVLKSDEMNGKLSQ